MLVDIDHRARKRFGQNFLHDARIIQHIVQAIHPQTDEHIVEIGPGLGAITELLIGHCAQLDLVELDKDLAAALTTAISGHTSVRLHQADALRFDFSTLRQSSARLRIVGNLPYNISTPLMFHLLEQRELIQDMTFMLQKEVVDRLCATPNSKSYGRLSVMMQYYCECRALFDVPPHAFNPQPKVMSAIVQLVPRDKPSLKADSDSALDKVVKTAFSQRRKTLRNTLKPLMSAEQIAECSVDPAKRAENLSVDDFVTLSNAFARQAQQ